MTRVVYTAEIKCDTFVMCFIIIFGCLYFFAFCYGFFLNFIFVLRLVRYVEERLIFRFAFIFLQFFFCCKIYDFILYSMKLLYIKIFNLNWFFFLAKIIKYDIPHGPHVIKLKIYFFTNTRSRTHTHTHSLVMLTAIEILQFNYISFFNCDKNIF